MSYLSVTDVDTTYKAALAAGAKSLSAPQDYGSAGRSATISDPTGGVFSLWRGAQATRPRSTTPPGGFVWNELATADEKMALAFYEKVFGFTHDEMDWATAPTTSSSRARRGAPACSRPRTRRCRRCGCRTSPSRIAGADQARSLGATLLVPPSDIPGVGRFAVFNDPQGASIAILKPDPAMG